MNCYNIQSEYRLWKFEYIWYKIKLIRMKVKEENDFLKISKSLIKNLNDINDKFIYQSYIYFHWFQDLLIFS